MFGIYFGKYLMEQGKITESDYREMIEICKDSKVQMGLLAVENGLMTEQQANEVNHLQQKEDKRFGDIAISMGYLTEEDLEDLLDRQGDPYLLFVQALIEKKLLTMDEIREELSAYRKDRNLTSLDLESIKTGDVDRIVPIFIKNKEMPEHFRNYFLLTSRNIVRFVDRFFRMEKVEKVDAFEVPCIIISPVIGDLPFYTMISGDEEGIRALAIGFVKTAFGNLDMVPDIMDAAKEFLNCNNGLFLGELSETVPNTNLDFPIIKEKKTEISAQCLYRMPVFVSDKEVNVFICDETFQMQEK